MHGPKNGRFRFKGKRLRCLIKKEGSDEIGERHTCLFAQHVKQSKSNLSELEVLDPAELTGHLLSSPPSSLNSLRPLPLGIRLSNITLAKRDHTVVLRSSSGRPFPPHLTVDLVGTQAAHSLGKSYMMFWFIWVGTQPSNGGGDSNHPGQLGDVPTYLIERSPDYHQERRNIDQISRAGTSSRQACPLLDLWEPVQVLGKKSYSEANCYMLVWSKTLVTSYIGSKP